MGVNMVILPAIDLYDGRAVRLTRGDYDKMTVYSDDPAAVARGFKASGAEQLHVVDLEGARDGTTANFEVIRAIAETSGLTLEVGGGIRSREVIEKYANAGIRRVILGTAAITLPGFVKEMVKSFHELIAVGVDIRDGLVAIKGWTETSDRDAFSFCRELRDIGVETIICTDISKDGVLEGANLELYRSLTHELTVNIIASGGITTIADVAALSGMGLYGAIIGKALYTGDITIKAAVAAANAEEGAR